MSILNYENMTKKQIVEELLTLQGEYSRCSAENERAISLLKKWYECWECAITPDKELERETEALFASVSTEQTPVCPDTAIEKANQKRDGDRQ